MLQVKKLLSDCLRNKIEGYYRQDLLGDCLRNKTCTLLQVLKLLSDCLRNKIERYIRHDLLSDCLRYKFATILWVNFVASVSANFASICITMVLSVASVSATKFATVLPVHFVASVSATKFATILHCPLCSECLRNKICSYVILVALCRNKFLLLYRQDLLGDCLRNKTCTLLQVLKLLSDCLRNKIERYIRHDLLSDCLRYKFATILWVNFVASVSANFASICITMVLSVASVSATKFATVLPVHFVASVSATKFATILHCPLCSECLRNKICSYVILVALCRNKFLLLYIRAICRNSSELRNTRTPGDFKSF